MAAKVVAGPPFTRGRHRRELAEVERLGGAIRTSASPVSWPPSWFVPLLAHHRRRAGREHPGALGRLASGPWIVTALMSPESSRFAAVPSFWMTLHHDGVGRPSP